MSAEHLWPQWIERLNPKYKGRYAFQTGGGATGKATLSWVKRSIDMKAHVVCEPCNNTWMSDVDEEARGTMKDMILHSAHVTLLPRGIKSIAAFAFKTSAIADSIDDHYSKPFFSYSDCKGFSAALAIPDGVQLWLAEFRGKHPFSGMYTTQYAKINQGRFRGFGLYIFTYLVGSLSVQLTALRWASIAKRPQLRPTLIQSSDWQRASVALWPNEKPVVWPPTSYLDNESIDQFCERWSKLEDFGLHQGLLG